MASSSSGYVAGLTVAAVATVGFLAYQASASVPDALAGARAGASPSAKPTKAPRDRKNPTALPGDSGTGERVVYSVDDDRVWLVSEKNKVQRTFQVVPGTVDPLPSTYTVTSRSAAITGSDGTPIEHVVRFASNEGVAIGFSAAVDGSTNPPSDPSQKLGGIRETREDATAMWEFATIGETIVVIK